MKYRYYYDRIRINTELPLEALDGWFSTGEFYHQRPACIRRIEIGEASELAQKYGYRGRIELYQATDKAVELLQQYGLERHSISRLEIARDRVCGNSLSARKFRQAFQNLHYVKWGRGGFGIGTSQYMGKEYGEERGMYVLCDKPRWGKLGHNHVVHIEFVFRRSRAVQDRLGVKTIYDLGRAEENFTHLSNKFIIRASVKHSRVQKHFDGIGDVTLPEFVELLSTEKKQIRETVFRYHVTSQLRKSLTRRRCGKKKRLMPYRYTKSELLKLERGIGYWVMVC
jgi:hypothetical protein